MRSHWPARTPVSGAPRVVGPAAAARYWKRPPFMGSASTARKTLAAPASVSLARTMIPALVSGSTICRLRTRARISKSPRTFWLTSWNESAVPPTSIPPERTVITVSPERTSSRCMPTAPTSLATQGAMGPLGGAGGGVSRRTASRAASGRAAASGGSWGSGPLPPWPGSAWWVVPWQAARRTTRTTATTPLRPRVNTAPSMQQNKLGWQRRAQPGVQLLPDRGVQRVVVPGARHQDELLRSAQRVVDPPRVRGRGLVVAGPVDDQRRHLDVRGGRQRAGLVDAELRLGLGDPEGLVDLVVAGEEGRPLAPHRAQIREGGDGDHRRHVPRLRRRLQRHRRPQRQPQQDDGPLLHARQHPQEVPLLVDAVGASVAARVAVSPAVVCQHL